MSCSDTVVDETLVQWQVWEPSMLRPSVGASWRSSCAVICRLHGSCGVSGDMENLASGAVVAHGSPARNCRDSAPGRPWPRRVTAPGCHGQAERAERRLGAQDDSDPRRYIRAQIVAFGPTGTSPELRRGQVIYSFGRIRERSARPSASQKGIRKTPERGPTAESGRV